MTAEIKERFTLTVTGTAGCCPVGEKEGDSNATERKIPVVSCEGGCIRGEIARQAANIVARHEPFRRGCHGELLTVPRSGIARWMRESERVVIIDGCFLRCHGRILENLLGRQNLVEVDALSVYRKYTDLFDVDAVPEAERLQAALQVADHVLQRAVKGRRGDTIAPETRDSSDRDRCLADPPSASPVGIARTPGGTGGLP